MVLSETQIPLVAHTAALRVYLSLAYDPIGAFFTHSLEHHHTIYHLPHGQSELKELFLFTAHSLPQRPLGPGSASLPPRSLFMGLCPQHLPHYPAGISPRSVHALNQDTGLPIKLFGL